MAEHFISRADAERDLLSCAAYLAEAIRSSEGRGQAMRAVVPQYLAKKDVDLAAELANKVDDPYVRDRLLTSVAAKCAELGDDEYAFQLVDAIDEAGLRSEARERIALNLISRGEIDKAYELADTIDHRDHVLAELAVRQYREGDEDRAFETIGGIDFPSAAAHALMAVAALKIEKEDAEGAGEVLETSLFRVEEIEHPEERIRTTLEVADAFLSSKLPDRSLEVLNSARDQTEVLDSTHRSSLLSLAALGYFKAGNIELADETLDLISDKTVVSSCLLGFAREYWRKDEKEDALEGLEESYSIIKAQRDSEIRDSKARYALYSAVAVQFAAFDQGQRGIDVAREIIDEVESSNALTRIAMIYAAQDTAMTRQALDGIEDDARRIFALAGVSDQLKKAGERDAALTFLDEAFSLASTIPQRVARSSAYDELAERYHDFGEAEKCRAAIDENLENIVAILDESSRIDALLGLAKVLQESGIETGEKEDALLRQLLVGN